MNSKQAEIWLAMLYTGSMVFSITSVISLVVTWQNWLLTLDGCIDVNCGCILYGINTFHTFLGGDEKLCHFAAYALTPVTVISLCLGAYHGYRCCIYKNLEEPKQINVPVCNDDRRNLNGHVIIHVKKRSVFKWWMPIGFLAAFVCCLSLAHAVITTDGYYKTCEQYRRNLIHTLEARGREILVIHNRLSCGAIFDYMDYVPPDNNHWRRNEMNTGIALQLAISTSWFNFFAWLAACSINFIMARKKQRNLGEKFCCCCC